MTFALPGFILKKESLREGLRGLGRRPMVMHLALARGGHPSIMWGRY